MPRRKRDDVPKPLPTIWRVSDDLWAKIEPILAAYDPPERHGAQADQPAQGLGWHHLPLAQWRTVEPTAEGVRR